MDWEAKLAVSDGDRIKIRRGCLSCSRSFASPPILSLILLISPLSSSQILLFKFVKVTFSGFALQISLHI